MSGQCETALDDHATFARRCEPGATVHQRLIFRGLDEARGDEPFEATAAGGKLAPVMLGKIDHDEACRRQPVVELMRLAAAAREQQPRRVIQTWIVADHQERGG